MEEGGIQLISGVLCLPGLLDLERGRIPDATICGLIADEVIPPKRIADVPVISVDTVFARVDIVSMTTRVGGSSYVKGSLITAIDRTYMDRAKSKPSGRLAVMLSGAPLATLKGHPNFVQMIKYRRNNHGIWAVDNTQIKPVVPGVHDDILEIISKAYRNNWEIVFPEPIPGGYTESCEGHVWEIATPKSSVEPTPITPKHTPVEISFSTKPVQPESPPPQNTGSNPFPIPGAAPFPVPSSPPPVSSVPEFNGASQPFGGADTKQPDNATQATNNKVESEIRRAPEPSPVKTRAVKAGTLPPESPHMKILRESLQSSKTKVDKLLDSMKQRYALISEEEEEKDKVVFEENGEYPVEEDDIEEEAPVKEPADKRLRDLVSKIEKAWRSKQGEYTGRDLFKRAMDKTLPEEIDPEEFEMLLTIMEHELPSKFFELSKADEEKKLNENAVIKAMKKNSDKFYFSAIEVMLGIRGKLGSALEQTLVLEMSLDKILETNPYELCILDPSIGVEDLDKLAMMFGIDMRKEEVTKARNVAYMHNYMLNASNRVVGDNTAVPYNELIKNTKAGYLFSKHLVDTLAIQGYIIKEDILKSIKYYLRENVSFKSFALSKVGWQRSGTKYLLQRGETPQQVVLDYTVSGIGVTFKVGGVAYVSDYIFFTKEIYIHDKLRRMASRKLRVDKQKLDETIKLFQESKDKEFGLEPGTFQLEDRQGDAVRGVVSPILALTGPAGSGKTTTAEGLVFAGEDILGLDVDSVYFCTPTGKAAGRLREVVKRKTSTVNSLFSFGGDIIDLKNEDDVYTLKHIRLLVMDESSMPNINTMYEVLIRLDEYTNIYFLGDIEQLPPIGFGKPFANMLKFLPSVALNVTKRASAKSYVTRNAKKIIEETDVITDLVDGPEFRIIDTKDIQFGVAKVLEIVRHHVGYPGNYGFTPVTCEGESLENLTAEDIQVITPLNKNDWGIVALNPRLQDIINPRKPGQKYISTQRYEEDFEYRLGDRVIHTRKNMNKMIRFKREQVPTEFTVIENSEGISNGDVGFVKGFVLGSQIEINHSDEEEANTLNQRYRSGDNTIYLDVEFLDTDIETGLPLRFSVLYRTQLVHTEGNCLHVSSTDLDYLDLAYAMTVDRMQGSQAKLTISLMYRVGLGTSTFSSRNRLYTMLSRAQKAGYLVGDVYGQSSAVNMARKVEANSRRRSVLDVAYK